MSPHWGRAVGISLLFLCLLSFGVGVVRLNAAHRMLPHVDEPRALELTLRYQFEYSRLSPQERERRVSEIAGLRTAKWPLYNSGVRICLIAGTLVIAILCFRLWDIRNFRFITTPRTRWRLIRLTSVAWLALIPLVGLDISDGAAQDDLRLLEDAGLGEGLSMISLAIVVTWVISVVICRFAVLRRARFPAMLWSADCRWTNRNVGLTVFYGLAAVASAAFTTLAIVAFKWGIPSGLVGIYVLLSSRAGLLDRAA